jgi:hypothetical protein
MVQRRLQQEIIDLSPTVSKGFHISCSDIKAVRKFVVYSGQETFTIGNDITLLSLKGIMRLILDLHC